MSFSNVPTTSVTILTAGLDYWSWLCVAGEPYPPTLTANYAYGIWSGITCIVPSGSLTVPATLTWPTIPMFSPRTNTFTGFTASVSLALTTNGFAGTNTPFIITLPGNITLNLNQSNGGNTWTITTVANGVTPGFVYPVTAVNLVDGVFHKYSVIVSGTVASTTVAFYLDAILIATVTAAISTTTSQFKLLWQSDVNTTVRGITLPSLQFTT